MLIDCAMPMNVQQTTYANELHVNVQHDKIVDTFTFNF